MEHAMTTKRPATIEVLLDVPDGMNGELVDGEIFASPRPAMLHDVAGLFMSAQEFHSLSWFGRSCTSRLMSQRMTLGNFRMSSVATARLLKADFSDIAVKAIEESGLTINEIVKRSGAGRSKVSEVKNGGDRFGVN